MSSILSHTGQGNAADITLNNLALASASAFAVVIPAQAGGQFVVVDTFLRVSLPTDHGGIRLNWMVPASWPLAELRTDWIAFDSGSNEPGTRLLVPAVNDPQHVDSVILPPGALARTVRINASHLFRAPAAGATINLQAAKVASGASPVVLAFSHIEIRMFT